MRNVERLKEVTNITPGFYPIYSKVLTIKDVPVIGGHVVEGYSEALRDYVPIEREAIRPTISPSKVEDFIFADFQNYSTYLITADYKASDFFVRFPYTASYIQKCVEHNIDGTLLWRDMPIRSNLREYIDRKKVIISTLGNICHAMLDDETHLVTSLRTYLCTFPYEDLQTYKAYTAIFNSRLFSYILFHELKNKQDTRHGRFDILANMPVPIKSDDFVLLECISECLFFLSKPDIPQLSYRLSNIRLGYYLEKILDMIVYELYCPNYVQQRGLDVISHLIRAPFMFTMMGIEERILQTYSWFQHPDNIVRQKIDLLDTRSPELLYRIQTFEPNEQD